MTEGKSKVQFIQTPKGEDLAILPRASFERLRELAEDRLDAEDARAALARMRAGEEELVPQNVVDRLLSGESPIRVWREHRGLTQVRLASAAGIKKAYLSQIESRQRKGTVATLRTLARALRVDLDDLIDPRQSEI
jgi:DNA-binding XRE family transcriptional regulator